MANEPVKFPEETCISLNCDPTRWINYDARIELENWLYNNTIDAEIIYSKHQQTFGQTPYPCMEYFIPESKVTLFMLQWG